MDKGKKGVREGRERRKKAVGKYGKKCVIASLISQVLALRKSSALEV